MNDTFISLFTRRMEDECILCPAHVSFFSGVFVLCQTGTLRKRDGWGEGRGLVPGSGVGGDSCSMKRAILSAFLSFLFFFYLNVFCSVSSQSAHSRPLCQCCILKPLFFVNFLCFSFKKTKKKKARTIYLSLHAVWNF